MLLILKYSAILGAYLVACPDEEIGRDTPDNEFKNKVKAKNCEENCHYFDGYKNTSSEKLIKCKYYIENQREKEEKEVI